MLTDPTHSYIWKQRCNLNPVNTHVNWLTCKSSVYRCISIYTSDLVTYWYVSPPWCTAVYPDQITYTSLYTWITSLKVILSPSHLPSKPLWLNLSRTAFPLEKSWCYLTRIKTELGSSQLYIQQPFWCLKHSVREEWLEVF